jgi:AraC family transcriptional regulator
METFHTTDSRSTTHPSDITKSEWTLSRQGIYANGLVVEHNQATAAELEPPPMTHHVFPVFLTGGAHHVARVEGAVYEGRQQPGDIWLLPAGCSGYFRWDDPGEVIMFILDPQLLQQTALEIDRLNSNKVELLPTLYIQDSTLEAIARSFHHEIQNNNLGSKLYLEALANLLMVHMLRNYCAFTPKLQTYTGGLSPKKLKQAINYIQENLHQDLRLTAIAQELDMTQSYFCTLFKQSTGITPHQYVLQQRIEQAKQLLEQSDMEISEISVKCGFASQSHFTKHFHRFAKITPKVYRDNF